MTVRRRETHLVPQRADAVAKVSVPDLVGTLREGAQHDLLDPQISEKRRRLLRAPRVPLGTAFVGPGAQR